MRMLNKNPKLNCINLKIIWKQKKDITEKRDNFETPVLINSYIKMVSLNNNGVTFEISHLSFPVFLD